MKILIVIDYFQPQLGYSESFFSREFVKLGHEVVVLTSNYYFPFPNYKETMENTLGLRKVEEGEEIVDGVKVVRKKLLFEVFARVFFNGHEEILKSFNPELVLVNKSAGFSAVKLAFLKDQYKYKLVCYDSLLLSELLNGNVFVKELIYFLFRFLFSQILNSKVDRFIAVQQGTVDVMKKYFGIRKRIDLIPLGTDIEKFRYDKRQRDLYRKKYELAERDFVIIYTGKLIEAKGVHLLFEAFNTLIRNYPNTKLVIVGEGTIVYRKRCISLLEDQYHKDVLFIPFQEVSELFKFYSLADVAVWPLQDSTSMNDAAACELPFIANDELGDKTRISNNNALLYKKGSTIDLANKIKYLYGNPQLRKRMGENGRKLAEERLSWKEIAKEYLT